jgi:hypothetical protein
MEPRNRRHQFYFRKMAAVRKSWRHAEGNRAARSYRLRHVPHRTLITILNESLDGLSARTEFRCSGFCFSQFDDAVRADPGPSASGKFVHHRQEEFLR